MGWVVAFAVSFFFCTPGGTCGGGGGGHCGNGGDGIRKDSHSRCGGTGGWIRIVRKKQKTQETATKRVEIRDCQFAMLKLKDPMFQFKPCDSIGGDDGMILTFPGLKYDGWWTSETVTWREGVASKCRTFVYCRLRSARCLHVFTVGRFRFHPDSKAGLVPSCRPVFFTNHVLKNVEVYVCQYGNNVTYDTCVDAKIPPKIRSWILLKFNFTSHFTTTDFFGRVECMTNILSFGNLAYFRVLWLVCFFLPLELKDLLFPGCWWSKIQYL